MKKINKEVWNTELEIYENVLVEVPYTQEELDKMDKEVLEVEYASCVSFLASTDWIWAKQKDLGLTDIELYQKHNIIIDERIEKRNRMNELQELGIGVE